MRSWIHFDFNYFKNELKSMGSKNGWREDIFAGITVACVAIPLSLALAMASGVAPGVGLISAIIGGSIAAFFGGTRLAVTGPANSMAVLIAICVNEYGLGGLLVVGIICGLLQLLSGLLKFGRYAKLVPLSVVSAFTAGIGFIIFVGQLPKALQIVPPDATKIIYIIMHIGQYITTMNPMAFILAIITVVILKVLPRYFPKAPTPLIAVAIPTIILLAFGIHGISQVGSIPHSIAMPKLPDFSAITNWRSLIEIAIEVFLLASLETLLSSSAVDSMGKGDLHNPNQELVGQGLANIGVAMFGGIPVTGVIARSSVNIAAGAKTRRSAIIHSLVIIGVVYLCPRLVEIIPVPALAGILLAVGMSMMNINEVVAYWKSDKSEFLVYIITFFAIITTDLIYGIKMGVFIAFLIVGLKMLTTKVDFRLWANKEVLRIGLSGNMTFWSFDKLERVQEYVLQHTEIKFVLFDLESLRGMDQTGASHLLNIVKVIKSSGIQVIIHDLSDEQVKVMDFICPDQKPYIATITESQIKDILEAYGINHSAEDLLKHGMEKFLMQYAHERKALLNSLAQEQKPHTLLIACSDSRVNPNTFLSAGLGELFIVRNVGNVVPRYNSNNYTYSEGAAIEFALGALGIRNIVICGHTECGAIKACVHNQPIDSIGLKNWLQIIKDGFIENKAPQDVYQGVKFNLINQVEHLKTYPLVEKLLSLGELSISAWVYDVKTANILEWREEKLQFEVIKHAVAPLCMN
ncbi:MAG: bifunctional SulP family inorganic anion transporter/carbonic anhydrase [Burkholderiales bacterium]|nr:bifunctional SulP family inorganic anion transporter/carbonic anhydrase [Burkholderiales bacterium]